MHASSSGCTSAAILASGVVPRAVALSAVGRDDGSGGDDSVTNRAATARRRRLGRRQLGRRRGRGVVGGIDVASREASREVSAARATAFLLHARTRTAHDQVSLRTRGAGRRARARWRRTNPRRKQLSHLREGADGHHLSAQGYTGGAAGAAAVGRTSSPAVRPGRGPRGTASGECPRAAKFKTRCDRDV